jgi:anti-sigma regulatory factor (Ser/Thr protein kinase)
MSARAEVVLLEIPCDENAPGSVRHALARFDSLGWILGDVMLIASELVSNAVLHSGCSSENLLEVEARLGTDQMMITVSDPGLSGGSAMTRSGADTTGGWGLRLVDLLAARWGSDRSDGYRVWAEIAINPRAPGRSLWAAPSAGDESAQ